MPVAIDPTDFLERTFHRLTVKEVLPKNDKGRWMYRCLCACGNECVLPRNKLRHDGTQSCGCLRREHIHAQRITQGRLLGLARRKGVATCL